MLKASMLSALMALACWAVSPAHCAESKAGNGLRISVHLPQKEFAVYEPVFLSLCFENGTNTTLAVIRPSLSKGTLVLGLSRVNDGKKFKLVTESAAPGLIGTDEVPARGRADLILNVLELFRFADTVIGEYRLKVTYGNLHGLGVKKENALPRHAFEQVLGFVVRRPSKAEDRASDYVMTKWSPLLTPDAYCIAAPMIALFYEDTPYYKYAYYWLGLLTEFPDPERSVYCFEKLLSEFPDFALADEVRHKVLEIRKRRGEVADYRKELKSLLDKTTELRVRAMIESRLSKVPH